MTRRVFHSSLNSQRKFFSKFRKLLYFRKSSHSTENSGRIILVRKFGCTSSMRLSRCWKIRKILFYSSVEVFESSNQNFSPNAKCLSRITTWCNHIPYLVKVCENSKKLWKHSPTECVPTEFLGFSNFHSCFCLSTSCYGL